MVMGKTGFKKSSANLVILRWIFIENHKIKPEFSVLYMRYRFSVLQCFAPK
jgi:hypothetical protein